MITTDEILREAAERDSKDVMATHATNPAGALSSMAYLKYVMGIRQEEMLQILYTAGLLTEEQFHKGPDYEGLSAAMQKALSIAEVKYVSVVLKGAGIDDISSFKRDVVLPGIRGAFSIGVPIESCIESVKRSSARDA